MEIENSGITMPKGRKIYNKGPGQDTFVCCEDGCKYTTHSSTGFRLHANVSHNKVPSSDSVASIYRCGVCGLIFHSIFSFDRHVRVEGHVDHHQ